MAAARHNLTRRALLGAGAAAPLALAASAASASPAAACPERSRRASRRRWNRALAAFGEAQAALDAFWDWQDSLPAERREWPQVQPLERRFGELDDVRLARLRRLLRLPAPDLAALALKLELAVADQAWELTDCESCLAAAAADARRLCHGG